MPTIVRSGKLDGVIDTNDHAPAHVHVDDCSVKVDLATLAVTEIIGSPKRKDVRDAVIVVATHRGALTAAWKKIHP